MFSPNFLNLSYLGGPLHSHAMFGGYGAPQMPMGGPYQMTAHGTMMPQYRGPAVNTFMPQHGTMMPFAPMGAPVGGTMRPAPSQINLSALGGSQMRRSPMGY